MASLSGREVAVDLEEASIPATAECVDGEFPEVGVVGCGLG